MGEMGSPAKRAGGYADWTGRKPIEEIASRIAAATRSNDDAVAVPGLEESGVEVKPAYNLGDLVNGITESNRHSEIPASEWSPTIGQPESANSVSGTNVRDGVSGTNLGDVDLGDGHYMKDDVLYHDLVYRVPQFSIAPANDNYTILRTILDAAFNHAATGKGKERHARDLPFDEQTMLETTRLVGPGFPLGQAIKKAGEAAGMIEREQYDAAEAECLGAINYLAGAVAWMREQAKVRRAA